ncbi:MAG: phosphoribosyltransferase family protein, partial [Victivallaceae bacterium]|nr:phosphoribosyltransferase family protein [Victivallaceae bacterium]
AEITRFYAGKPLTVAVVLNGGLFFGAALSRRLKLKDLYIDTLAISSYEHDRSNGNMAFRADLKLPVKGRNILLVDEVLDSGRTFKMLLPLMISRGADSVRSAVLVSKAVARPAGIDHADWTGFVAPDRYLIGCGMDSCECFRHLGCIAALD